MNAVGEYRAAFEQARAANEARYNQALAGYDALAATQANWKKSVGKMYNQIIADASNVGDSQRIQLGMQFDRQAARARQSLVDRGLGSTTVLDSAERGVGYDRALANIVLSDALSREKSGYSERKIGAMSNEQRAVNAIYGEKL